MSTFSTSPPPPPPLILINGGSATPTDVINQIPQQQQPPYLDTSSTSPSSASSIVIVIIIIASAVIVSASIYLLLRLLSKRFHRSFRTFASADDVVLRHDSADSNTNSSQYHVVSNNMLDSLPLFTFGSITGNLTGGDCAVCLSKFEPLDQLRLLPLCCHAFHAGCIDTWLVSNQTCPLCRSSVLPSDPEILDKILLAETGGGNIDNNFENRNGSENGGSFRIEMGSISRRRGTEDTGGAGRRSYSIGSFEYIVDNGYEVSMGSTTHRRGLSDCTSVDKESSIGVPVPELPGEVLAGEISRGRSWLRDYVDRLASISVSSRSISFRSSGRFFTGSSGRSGNVVAVEDLEANRVGEEISELFRWLSGV
ncbi:E3 ubiquitin-protein ligase [Forsythia ovata]|uniref:E3 ubiquitin-protein ligase n=1 Tax=Forsythia ovata TaxID=205694 RepID=A0ABD1TMV3_9LAMI